jgi:hypothetical protein
VEHIRYTARHGRSTTEIPWASRDGWYSSCLGPYGEKMPFLQFRGSLVEAQLRARVQACLQLGEEFPEDLDWIAS